MHNEPWEVPETAEGRTTLERLAEEYEKRGQRREQGITLSRLARLYKQIGTGDDAVPAWTASSSAGARAVELLRQTDDKKELATALRQAALPFIEGLNREAMLEEALAISEDIGDWSGQGWALYAMLSPGPPDSDKLEAARVYFERAGDGHGLGVIYQRMGVQNRDPDKIVVAAESFEANGKLRHAEEAYVMAQLFGRDKLSVDEREAMLLKAVALAGTRGSPDRQTLYYGNLADLMDDAGRQDDSKRYAELRKALEG